VLVRVFQFDFSQYNALKRSHINIDCPVQAAKWHSVPNFLKNGVSLTKCSQHMLRISTWNFILEFQSAKAFPRPLDCEPSVALCETDANLPFSKAGEQAVPKVLAPDNLSLPVAVCEQKLSFDFEGHPLKSPF